MNLYLCKEILNSVVPVSNFTDCVPLMPKQTPLCSVNTFLLLKHWKQLAKVFFVFIFCFMKHKSVKILRCTHNVTCFHFLKATNQLNFQIFDQKCKLER